MAVSFIGVATLFFDANFAIVIICCHFFMRFYALFLTSKPFNYFIP